MINWKITGTVATVVLGFGVGTVSTILGALNKHSCASNLADVNGAYGIIGSVLTLIYLFILIKMSPLEMQFYRTYALGINLKPLPGDVKAYTGIVPGHMTSQQRVMHNARLAAVQSRLDGVYETTYVHPVFWISFTLMVLGSIAWAIVAIIVAKRFDMTCAGATALRTWTFVSGALVIFNGVFQMLNYLFYRPWSLDIPTIIKSLYRALDRHNRFLETQGETWSSSSEDEDDDWSSDSEYSSDYTDSSDEESSESRNRRHHGRHRNKRTSQKIQVTAKIAPKDDKKNDKDNVSKATGSNGNNDRKKSTSVPRSASRTPAGGSTTTKGTGSTTSGFNNVPLTTTINPPLDSQMIAALHKRAERAAKARGESVPAPRIEVVPNEPILIRYGAPDPDQIQPILTNPHVPPVQIQPQPITQPLLPAQPLQPAPVPEQLLIKIKEQRRKSQIVDEEPELPAIAFPIVPQLPQLRSNEPRSPIAGMPVDHEITDDVSEEYTHESLDISQHDIELSVEPQYNPADFEYPDPKQQIHRRSH